MTEDEIYLFDLNGYLVVEQVMTPQEVAQANAAIDRYADQIEYRSREGSLSRNSPALRGTHGRSELGGMLGWKKPWCEPFRRMLAHRRIADYLNAILGCGYRAGSWAIAARR